ncbi:MAG: hypothetical protein JXX29_09970 [Deltaproteobacteria bacterium]|nr:hypothetical protein [Deltaproteobacteria bacterium]MBN2671992.1 hypothetical protein [Deltaproteobacteria bacterium]
MHCKPTATVEELKIILDALLETDGERACVTDQETLTDALLEQLACNSLHGVPAVARESQLAIWNICQFMGTPYTSCTQLVQCMTRDKISDMIVPIVDATWIPFELLCIILAAGKETEVGPLIFTVNKKDPARRGVVCQILCAALKNNWQAPVLFYDGEEKLPVETVHLDWKKMLYFNSYELSHEPLESLMGKMLREKFEDLTPEHWRQLIDIPKKSWAPLSEEIFDVYCDLFEELDINETFPLLKRYVIPQWSKKSILETI